MQDLCTAADVMSRTPIIFPVLVRVGDMLDKLRMCEVSHKLATEGPIH